MMIIRIFINILIFYVWCYINNELLLVIIINNFVLKKIVCIYICIVKNLMKWCKKVVFGKKYWCKIVVKNESGFC